MSSPADNLIARLEEFGPNQVRVMLASGSFPTQSHLRIFEWLADKDRQEREQIEASQQEQIQTALSAKKAAWIAAIAAIVAAIVAIMGAVIAWLSWA